MTKLFELGGNATIFWDPTQPKEENQKLLVGQKKELEETEEVRKAISFNYLRVVSKGELEETEPKTEETEEKAKKK
jgi:hypothetical protein